MCRRSSDQFLWLDMLVLVEEVKFKLLDHKIEIITEVFFGTTADLKQGQVFGFPLNGHFKGVFHSM